VPLERPDALVEAAAGKGMRVKTLDENRKPVLEPMAVGEKMSPKQKDMTQKEMKSSSTRGPAR